MALQTDTALLVGLLFLIHTWGVEAQVKVEVEGRVKVSLGEDAEIPCLYTTVDGVAGLTIEWLYLDAGGKRHRIFLQDPDMRNEEPDTPFRGRIRVNGTRVGGQVVLTVLKARPLDEVDFICRVRSLTDGTDEGATQLRVFATPDPPTITPEATPIWYMNTEPVLVATCEAKNGYPEPTITWYKDHMPLLDVRNQVSVRPSSTTEGSRLTTVKSELSINVVKEDKDSEFYCEVNYKTVEGDSMMESYKTKIPVHYPTDKVNLWVESPKGAVKTGDTVEFHCQGNGNPQPNFEFRFMGGEGDLVSNNNTLVLRDVGLVDSGLYECFTLHVETYEEVVGNHSLMVIYLHPAAVVPEQYVALQGEGINASCNAMSSMNTTYVWKKNGVGVATGNILSLTNLTYDMAGVYECTVTVPDVVGMETSAPMQLAVHGVPEIRPPRTTSLEQMLDSEVELTCSAWGIPKPNITWSPSEVEIHSVTSIGDLVESHARVQLTADMNVICIASNLNGETELLFSIKAIMPTTDPIDPRNSTESNGVIIAVIMVCLLLLAVLGSVLFFLYKKGKICGRSSKQDLTKEKTSRDNIVVEMKNDNTEEAVLLSVNGDRKQNVYTGCPDIQHAC